MRKQEEEIEKIQFILQSPAQLQQYGAETQEGVNANVLCPINNAPMVRQNRVTSNTMATKLNEDRLKTPLQGNAFDDRTFKVLHLFEDYNIDLIFLYDFYHNIICFYFIPFNIQIMNAYTRGQLPNEDCALLLNEIAPITGGQPSGCLLIICL
jgi:hypothetical protein